MAYPVSYKDFSLPVLMDYILSFLGLMKELLFVILFHYSGVEAFRNPNICWPTRLKTRHDVPLPSPLAVLTREHLPVVKYSELVDPPESCAVCLHEFSDSEEIRRLMNCQHIFHQNCVDCWIDQEKMTCPLCRRPFISEEMQEASDEKIWSDSGISDFY